VEQSFDAPPFCPDQPPGGRSAGHHQPHQRRDDQVRVKCFPGLKRSVSPTRSPTSVNALARTSRRSRRVSGLDSRIGPRFLNAGIGWGGSCFGKTSIANSTPRGNTATGPYPGSIPGSQPLATPGGDPEAPGTALILKGAASPCWDWPSSRDRRPPRRSEPADCGEAPAHGRTRQGVRSGRHGCLPRQNPDLRCSTVLPPRMPSLAPMPPFWSPSGRNSPASIGCHGSQDDPPRAGGRPQPLRSRPRAKPASTIAASDAPAEDKPAGTDALERPERPRVNSPWRRVSSNPAPDQPSPYLFKHILATARVVQTAYRLKSISARRAPGPHRSLTPVPRARFHRGPDLGLQRGLGNSSHLECQRRPSPRVARRLKKAIKRGPGQVCAVKACGERNYQN